MNQKVIDRSKDLVLRKEKLMHPEIYIRLSHLESVFNSFLLANNNFKKELSDYLNLYAVGAIFLEHDAYCLHLIQKGIEIPDEFKNMDLVHSLKHEKLLLVLSNYTDVSRTLLKNVLNEYYYKVLTRKDIRQYFKNPDPLIHQNKPVGLVSRINILNDIMKNYHNNTPFNVSVLVNRTYSDNEILYLLDRITINDFVDLFLPNPLELQFHDLLVSKKLLSSESFVLNNELIDIITVKLGRNVLYSSDQSIVHKMHKQLREYFTGNGLIIDIDINSPNPSFLHKLIYVNFGKYNQLEPSINVQEILNCPCLGYDFLFNLLLLVGVDYKISVQNILHCDDLNMDDLIFKLLMNLFFMQIQIFYL